jgi:hypothetical protein
MPHLAYEYLTSGVSKTPSVHPPLAGLAGAPGATLPGFPGPGGGLSAVLALADHIPLTRTALIAAASINGRLPWSHSPADEVAWRVGSLFAAAEFESDFLTPTAILDNLESQEKRALSYSLGMTLALYAGWAAGLRFPVHFSLYVRGHGGRGRAYVATPRLGRGPGLPDLAWVDPARSQCTYGSARVVSVGVGQPPA